MGTVRRVVTGVDASGKSVVVSDSGVPALTAEALPGYSWHRVWGFDTVPETPNDGTAPAAHAYFPPPGGHRFIVHTLPPESTRPAGVVNSETARKELDEKFPGRSRRLESDQVGMHTTASIDFIYVVAGEVWLELDDGAEVHLRPGDTLIQNGVRHHWRNHSDQPCTMVISLIGTDRST